jgi:transcriptional regulator with XRE-family HTH domain
MPVEEAFTSTDPRPDFFDLVQAGRRVLAYRLTHQVSRNNKLQPMTQAEFARRAGVSVGCLAMMETGTRTPRWTSLQKIAAAAELTVDQLLAPLDEPAPAKPSDLVRGIADLLEAADPAFQQEIKRQVLSHLLSSTTEGARRVIEQLHLAPERREEVQSRASSSTGMFRETPSLKNGSGK